MSHAKNLNEHGNHEGEFTLGVGGWAWLGRRHMRPTLRAIIAANAAGSPSAYRRRFADASAWSASRRLSASARRLAFRERSGEECGAT